MTLYLVQHGKSNTKEVDPTRALTDEGYCEVQQVSRIAEEKGLHLDKIWHSGKLRARQTVGIIAGNIAPANGIESIDGINPNDDVIEFSSKISPDTKDLMIVGHMPFMEKFAAYLVSGQAEKPVMKFVNGGIVALEYNEKSENWVISSTILPE